MSYRAGRDEGVNKAQAIFAGLIIAGLSLAGIASALAQEEKPGEIESRGMPQLQRPMQPGSPTQPGTPGQPNAQLPTFPQKFDVKGPEIDSFGFAVTQPGPVVVDVQSQGAPVIVTLQGPAPQPISQQGMGPARLTYMVTPQDVQKSLLWRVQVRLAQPAPPSMGGRATGMVNVQYPPVNQAAVQQAIQARTKQRKELTEQEQQQAAAQTAAKMEAAFQQHKAQFDRQQMDRRAMLDAQIRPQLDQLQSRMGGQVRPRGLEGSEGASGETGAPQEGEIGTRALRGERLSSTIEKPMDLQRSPAIVQPPPTASSAQPIQSAGSGQGPQTVMPNPAITSLSVAQGQPGDPVIITGSAFGTGGEVHFVIGPGKELVAPAGAIWSDNQIFATVPDATGVVGFNGTVYVKRVAGNVNSNLVPFRFNPAMELRQITRMTESQLQQFNGVTVFNQNGYYVRRMHSFMFWGPKGNDQIYLNARLKNGWVVSQVPLVYLSFPAFTDGGAYLVESHVGTDRPHMNVGFWVDDWFSNMFSGGNSPTLDYSISMLIQGPKGVPDGVVVP